MNGATIGYDRMNFPSAHLGTMDPEGVAFWEPPEADPTCFNDGANFPYEGLTDRHSNGWSIARFDGSTAFEKATTWQLHSYSKQKNEVWCYPETPTGR
jgi:hypothetical protein